MPSINRSTYLTPIQRFTQPGGYDVMSTGHGTRAILEFDPDRGGLQRRIGKRPLYEDLLRYGAQPTGRRIGPPGFESDEYSVPFPIVGSPVWSQGRKPKRETVFGDYGSCGCGPVGLGTFQGVVVPAAFAIAVGAALYYGFNYLRGTA